MNRRGRKGVLGYVFDVAMAVIVVAIVVAFFRINNITSITDLYSIAKDKSVATKACYKSRGEGCLVLPDVSGGSSSDGSSGANVDDGKITDEDIGYKGPIAGEAFIQDTAKISKEYVLAALDKMNVVKLIEEKKENKVDPKEWAYFSPVGDSKCWTVKKEVLSLQANPESIKYATKSHEETDDKTKACSIVSGEWIDPYSGDKVEDPSLMTVDHIVSISDANKSGGKDWTPEKKKEFANDKDNVLLAVSKKSKESRDGKTIDKFKVDNEAYRCEFAKNYTLIKNKYELTVTDKEKKALSKALVKCDK